MTMIQKFFEQAVVAAYRPVIAVRIKDDICLSEADINVAFAEFKGNMAMASALGLKGDYSMDDLSRINAIILGEDVQLV